VTRRSRQIALVMTWGFSPRYLSPSTTGDSSPAFLLAVGRAVRRLRPFALHAGPPLKPLKIVRVFPVEGISFFFPLKTASRERLGANGNRSLEGLNPGPCLPPTSTLGIDREFPHCSFLRKGMTGPYCGIRQVRFEDFYNTT